MMTANEKRTQQQKIQQQKERERERHFNKIIFEETNHLFHKKTQRQEEDITV